MFVHIALIGYLFVIAMLAVASGGWIRGGVILLFLGLLPCWLVLWRLRRKQLRRLRK